MEKYALSFRRSKSDEWLSHLIVGPDDTVYKPREHAVSVALRICTASSSPQPVLLRRACGPFPILRLPLSGRLRLVRLL